MNMVGLDPALVAEVERETSELLSELIQIDTSNPPGNETAVAEFMAAWFRGHGLEGEVVGEPADRASFVFRLEGRRSGPSLLLLAHEDVVPANAADWQVPPFSGLIKDGYVWGRGAVDIKNLVAANAVAMRRLAAAGAPFDGTVTYACTADEESCTGGGVRWLLEHRPDLMRCDYVLNEGDGAFIPCGERRLFMLQSGEKGTAQFRLVVHGQAGHGSVPLRRGNAVLAAARVVEALAAHELPVVIDESSRDLVESLVEDPELRARLRDATLARAALADLADRDPQLADMIAPLYGFAFSPTIVQSNSVAVNVFPTRVVLSVDCRMLAGHDEGEVEAEVRAALDGVDARWELAVDQRDPRQLLPVSHAALGGHPQRCCGARSRTPSSATRTASASPTLTGSAPPTPMSWPTIWTPISRSATPTCRPGRTTWTSASSCAILPLRRSSRSRWRWSC